MQGIDIAKKYYEEFGAPAIHENFPELEGIIAVGLAGSGSECYGFDDKISTDHDFEPGFCMWIPEEDELDSRTGFRLERMYAKLPKEFMGLRKCIVQPAGGSRHGVIRISEFLERHTGRPDAEYTTDDWFGIPECALSEVVNGEIWRDDSGKFTEVRNKIRNMPADVRLKKLAGSLYLMGQSGSYNYSRCIAHGEKGAAQLSLAEFTRHTMHAAFLINMEYMPYYKWSFRALRSLMLLPELGDKLEFLMNTGNNPEDSEKKEAVIRDSVASVLDALRNLELSGDSSDDPGVHAEAVNRRIKDGGIRNAGLLAGINTAM